MADNINKIFAISSHIRYVATYRAGKLTKESRVRSGGASADESDKYEEIIVNPTLLTLVRQRGNIDCGGAKFVLIRYGHFYQLVVDLPDGHVSVAFELDSNPLRFVDEVTKICKEA